MSEVVYYALAHAAYGFVEAPAGCGKTEAIVKTVAAYCSGAQLILTHTHAGVDALEQRFRKYQVPASKYHIDTISGWAWGWVRRYPQNSGYVGSCDVPEWANVYPAMSGLLVRDFVRQGILNSYTGVIVDEYQDCTVPMHELIVQLKSFLPCRVLGDDLQGIFGFRRERLIDWGDVQESFSDNLGTLETPYRWINAGNEKLGRWLLRERSAFRHDREPDYSDSSIERTRLQYNDLGAELRRLTDEKKGRICIIGPKARRLHTAIETALVRRFYQILEPNDLTVLCDLILAFANGSATEKADAAIKFISETYGGISPDTKSFIAKILKGSSRRPKRSDRRALFEAHNQGATPALLADLIAHITSLKDTTCKLKASVSALKCILEEHRDSGVSLASLYAEEIAKRKNQSRISVSRCIGSTLLVKGLEFDHAVIVRSPKWQKNWGGYRDLYVALSRGSKSVSLIDLAS